MGEVSQEQSEEPTEVEQDASFTEDDLYAAADSRMDFDEEVDWKASEYIHHEKSSSWYFGLIGGVILVGVILYLVNNDLSSIGTITSYAVLVAMTAATIVYANRKPQTLEYHLDSEALTIGSREYLLDDFRSFSVFQEGKAPSVVLAPLKRFMPPVSVYYDQKDEEAIITILANVLPHEENEPDFVDQLIRKIRF